MSAVLRCSSFSGLEVRTSLRKIHNLSNALSSPRFPARKKSWTKYHSKINLLRIEKKSVFPSLELYVVGIRSFLSTNSSIREIRRPSNDWSERTKVGSLATGSVEGKGREIASKKSFVGTKEGPLDPSLETSRCQVSGDLEQDSEDASGDSFPHGTYQSPHSSCPPQAHNALSIQNEAMAELEDALGFPLGHDPQSPSPKPLVIVISGPSGVGKDAVIKKLQQVRRDIHFVVTATTRPMRPGEVDGVDYFFMSKTEFQEMIENHELLEHAIVYGDYKGIPKQQVRDYMTQGMDVVLRVDVQGAATVRSILGSEAVFIFLVAESEVVLVKRLIERKTETMDKMLVRVATAREELTRIEEFDYVVENQEGSLDKTVSLICSIIAAEKARVKPKAAEI